MLVFFELADETAGEQYSLTHLRDYGFNRVGGVHHHLFRSLLPGKEQGRIERVTSHADFEVQMRAGRAASGSDTRDFLAFLNQVAQLGLDGGCVRVTSDQAVSVVDFDQLSITRYIAGLGHHSA